jgi:hypothetical protein
LRERIVKISAQLPHRAGDERDGRGVGWVAAEPA